MNFKIGDIVKSSANEITSYKIVDLIVWNDTQILKVKPTDKHLSDLSFVVINDKYHATYTLISSSEKVGVDKVLGTGTFQDSAPISEKPKVDLQ